MAEWIGLGYVADAHHRLFWLYLAASALIAAAFAYARPAYRTMLFDKKIWWHPSARLDYLYFPVVSLLKVAAVVPLVLGANEAAQATLRLLHAVAGYRAPLAWDRDVIAALFTLTLFLVSDLTRYWLHRLLHTVPLLWRFHAVHHSAEALNPLTFYRVHPVENLLFGWRYALGAGAVTGVFVYFFGARLGIVEIVGVNIIVFVFGLLGANLRHTHVPLRFGDRAERWFVSPYMHQLHHTPEGMRSNYGGSLAVWDRLFGSLRIEKVRPLRFGLGRPVPHGSVPALLLEPFTSQKTTHKRKHPMKKILLSLCCASAMASAADNEALQQQIDALKAEIAEMKSSDTERSNALVDEIATLKDAVYSPVDTYDSVSSLGVAASKVYHSKSAVTIGGYGEYEYKKYTDFKNYDSNTANETRRKSEWNVVRFVPYIGFRFNDWIVMNTEIEFEDGGARSDDTKNYKYAIIEFSYLDFLLDEAFALRVGHVLVPMGLTNLNHEPVAYLTAERPTVETLIIPSTWHTNGVLTHGQIEDFEYYAGVVTSPDAGAFIEGRFIQQGRLGARQFTDDLGLVVRGTYDFGDGLDVGASAFYGSSSVAEESSPGTSTGVSGDADVMITLAEAHLAYRNHGFDVKAMAAYGALDGDVAELRTITGEAISNAVNGQYVTVGYDVLHGVGTAQQLYAVVDIERLDMDAEGVGDYPDNNRYFEYSGGIAYYPDPRVVVKADYWMRDYAEGAKLADEAAVTMQLGFIF